MSLQDRGGCAGDDSYRRVIGQHEGRQEFGKISGPRPLFVRKNIDRHCNRVNGSLPAFDIQVQQPRNLFRYGFKILWQKGEGHILQNMSTARLGGVDGLAINEAELRFGTGFDRDRCERCLAIIGYSDGINDRNAVLLVGIVDDGNDVGLEC